MEKGIVFSIEEFSTFDGPGIRTTVFLKGCPMRCMWCHNPEGQSFERQIVRSPNGCTGCGECLKAGKRKTGVACLVEESIKACPNNLVRYSGTVYTSDEICAKLAKNKRFYDISGGGITFSGGEPLSQATFLFECLDKLGKDYNKAIQTSGQAEKNIFLTAIEKADYFLYDLKMIDPEKHKEYIRSDNKNILENYGLLVRSGKDFITRIPLIPGVNDTVSNITETAELMSSLNVKKVEILPYNKMAGSKYKLVGREYSPTFDEKAEPNARKEIFERYGIAVTVL
ncbi:MAG: glycyl-radical enzyme activating protein [Clostridia bacterium]|nr:glycyl-radical enzyme activating protein [Clostridia bacterium]